MSPGRIGTLMAKELREFRSNPAAILPVAIVMAVATAVPFLMLIVVPRVTSQSLADDRTLHQVVTGAMARLPELAALPLAPAIEAFMFQQFLLLFQIAPIIGAVSLAAYSVVGEKQSRTLEPLLTTPLSTPEILIAKVLAAFLPSLAIEVIGLALYFALVATFALPGVVGALVSPRTLVLVGLVGPLAALAALQMTIAISSRANDPRSAQQLAVLIVLPLMLILVGQISGAFFVTTGMLLLLALALAVAWVILILLSVALFERETILTRWKGF
jgi:ABC-2 type transport system permease protein